MKRIVVVGLGNFGSAAAEALHAQGHEVVAVDVNEAAVDRMAPFVTRAAVGDGRSGDVLDRIGASGADAGIVGTGDDITASVLGTLAMRDLGVGEIYAKVTSRDHARVMEKLGVTETVFPERESAIRLAARFTAHGILNYVRLGEGFSVLEMAVPSAWIGRTLRELALPRHYRISIVAVHDVLMDEIIPVPPPDARLKESDTLLVAGRDEDLALASRVC
jgi:trk system potassium uptake protein